MPALRTHTRRSAILSAAATLTLTRSRSLYARDPLRIGFMTGLGYPELDEAFTGELRRQGLVEGRDLVIERRFARANSNDNAVMGRELANSNLVLVVVSALPAALVVREANPRMPMVIGTCPGMVANGFAKTLERPGGIYTGIDELPPGVTRRRMTLLKTAAPGIKRLALLSTAPGKVAHDLQLADALPAAADLGIEARPYRATNLDELRAALAKMRTDGMDGLQNFQGGLSLANRHRVDRRRGEPREFASRSRMSAQRANAPTTDNL